MKPVKTGIIGCGKISGIYLKNCTSVFSDILEVTTCADLVKERAQQQAEEYGIPNASTPEELLADESISLVINLTIPAVHGLVNKQALLAGKHVYVEKPLALTIEEAEETLAIAQKSNLLIGGAPDTFFGAGIQTCRKLIDEGVIGTPVGVSAFMACPGHESWHPDPEFYYKAGGGPMLDMGPYYITALVNLLGPVAEVSGMTGRASEKRLITSQPKNGTEIQVEVDTHQAGTLKFASGAIGTMIMSFDVKASNLPRIEIYGTEGTLSVPDPNTFGGPVKLFKNGEWKEVGLGGFQYAENSRGAGPADLALAAVHGRRPRAGGDLAIHVLETMLAFTESSESGAVKRLNTVCEQPAPLTESGLKA